MPSAKTIGVKELAIAGALAASVALGGYLLRVQGSASIRDSLNFEGTTATGADIRIGGISAFRVLPPTACTATGGLSKYTTCSISAPFSTTGALLAVDLSCGQNVAKALTGDVSFKKSLTSNTGTALTNLDGITMGSGSTEISWFATEQRWNAADILTFSTLTTPTGTLNTSRYDCKMSAIVRATYGE